MSYKLTNFRSTVVKPYYTLPETPQEEKGIEDIEPFDSDKDKLIDQTPFLKNNAEERPRPISIVVIY
jgi:hypothetical protein